MNATVSRIVAVLALVLPALLVPAAAEAHAAPYCGLRWGSLPKSSATIVNPSSAPGDLVTIRSGRHACYDRLVFDVDGSTQGYWVSYVDEVVAEGLGHAVATAGGDRLQVVVRAPAYDEQGRETLPQAAARPMVDVSGYRTFREVRWAGSYEGQSSVGLGVRARLPYRVFTLDGPGTSSRVVVDVAHRW